MKLLIILLACLLTSTCNKGTEYHIPPPVVSDKPSTPDTPVVEEPDADVLRLATYNVGVFSKSGTNTTLMIVEMMKELGVCALSMNELDSCNTRHQVFQLKSFAREMGSWDYTYAPALNYKGGWYGIGIASNPKLNIIRRFRLKLSQAGGSEVRALAVSEFQDFVFCSTHLDHKSKDAQLVQAGEITAWVEKELDNTFARRLYISGQQSFQVHRLYYGVQECRRPYRVEGRKDSCQVYHGRCGGGFRPSARICRYCY